jgi:hypothetical protein
MLRMLRIFHGYTIQLKYIFLDIYQEFRNLVRSPSSCHYLWRAKQELASDIQIWYAYTGCPEIVVPPPTAQTKKAVI